MTDTSTPEQAGNEATDPNAQQAAVPPVEVQPGATAQPGAAAPQAAAPQTPPEFAPAAPQAPNAAPAGAAPAGYPQQPVAAAPPTNPLAIVALIGSFFIGLVGIICGHIALGQIKKSNGQQGGRGLALAGTIIGYVQTAGVVIAIIMMVIAMSVAGTIAQQSLSTIEKAQQQLEEQGSEGLTDGSAGTDTQTDASGDRSPEFCDAYNKLSAMGEDIYDADGSVKSDTVAVFRKLAVISSPNQQVYKDFDGFLQEPTSAADTLMADSVKAAMEDAMACS
ncbi:MAG: DUF4190 domain-containing protein [Actinobacteria bacterium]|nr:DUF4190 domain-containing protein [Actinomycetota bacterium]